MHVERQETWIISCHTNPNMKRTKCETVSKDSNTPNNDNGFISCEVCKYTLVKISDIWNNFEILSDSDSDDELHEQYKNLGEFASTASILSGALCECCKRITCRWCSTMRTYCGILYISRHIISCEECYYKMYIRQRRRRRQNHPLHIHNAIQSAVKHYLIKDIANIVVQYITNRVSGYDAHWLASRGMIVDHSYR